MKDRQGTKALSIKSRKEPSRGPLEPLRALLGLTVPPRRLPSIFTPREQAVLDLMARGYGNKQIALSLCLSYQTVKNYVSRIFRKLNAAGRTDAVLKAIKSNLVSKGGPDE